MGGYMSYQRMRNRNGLFRTPADIGPYWILNDAKGELRSDLPDDVRMRVAGRSSDYLSHWYMATGDMNRMEHDYLGTWPDPSAAPARHAREGGTLSEEVAEMTGVDAETVRKVLRCVFLEQT